MNELWVIANLLDRLQRNERTSSDRVDLKAPVTRIVSVVSAMFPYDRFDRFGVFQSIGMIKWKPGLRTLLLGTGAL